MRDSVFATLVGFGILAGALMLALLAVQGSSEADAQASHTHESFAVEVAIKDR